MKSSTFIGQIKTGDVKSNTDLHSEKAAAQIY